MANFKTAIAAENEIMKAADVTFGYDSSIDNVAVALKAVLSNSAGDYVIGGKVKPYGSGGLNVSIEPIFAYKDSTGVCVAETDTTEPVSFEEADSSLDRIDIVEVMGEEEGYDSQSRKFNDPSTGTKTTQTVNTKKRIKLTVVVKKGSNGSESAPAVDAGYVKLAEVRIPAGTNNITSDLIKNVDARKYGEENTDWTTNKSATFNPSYLANIFYTFLVQHNEDGSHKNAVIKAANIDFGTGSGQVMGSSLPTGQSMSVHGVDFTSSESVTSLIQSLANNVNNLYKYSNDILSRFTFLADLPVACSTANVDIATGGEMTIDGVSVSIGQLVFLKDQTDAKENGFYEVQSGAWNRYAGYTTSAPSAFKHKLVFVKAGTANKGKVFYLNGDFEQIGTDELNFTESNFSPFAIANKAVIRDKDGRFRAKAPKDSEDVARKQEFDEATANTGSTEGRNLLTVLGVTTVAEAMEVLHERCNGEGVADFSGLMIGDYLDLPSLTVDGTTYTWNATYQNLRIVISGFNHYIHCGDTENTKNHILWTFKNVVLQRQMNSSDTNTGGYNASAMKTYLDGVFALGLGSALGSSDYLYTISRAISKKGSTEWVRNTVFLPTEVEVFGVATYGDDQIAWNTNIQYPIYRDSSYYRCKKYNGSRAWWWEATPNASNSTIFCTVNNYGGSDGGSASDSNGGVAPAFCTC
ncbi:DUF6273 domain-containing protein [Treponema sp.]|uniref:DUF6273 domain-containing protein n=1 Tax=Treponema sp. TaxID=166 RepID=UPI003F0B5A8E